LEDEGPASHRNYCIESVIKQTYDNWTYVVVDNKSTDATPDIVESYARSDSRIRLERHEEFVGAIPNHNRAFRTIDPDSAYCKVIQADDFMFPQCLELMVGLAVAHPSVGVISGYRIKQDDVDLVGLPNTQSVVTGSFILRQSLLGGPYVTGSPSSLMLRADLVRRCDPFYDARFYHADTEAAYWAFTQADFALVHEIVTFSRRQQGSRIGWAHRVNTFAPESFRMLLRYGPKVLSEDELRARMRLELTRYLSFHAKQRVKPSRWRDHEFHAFHRRMVGVIREESGGDARVRAAMALVRALLNPGMSEVGSS
jgi:glycosyltransferase involved in cell wall biosynthesis